MSTPIFLPWKTNVMGMFGECRVLLLSIVCPALAYYATSETFELNPAGVVESCIGGYCLCCGFLLRTRLRHKYSLDGSCLGDFIAHCCCHCVALARIWREAEVQKAAEKEMMQSPPTPSQLAPYSNPVPGQFHPSLPPQPVAPPLMMNIEPPIQQFIPPGAQSYGYADPHFQQPVYVPQSATVMQQHQQGVPVPTSEQPLQPNTVDTNLSDFESRHAASAVREEHASYKRIDSMDPPPSNNDPDPWDMLQRRENSLKRRQEANAHTAMAELRRPTTARRQSYPATDGGPERPRIDTQMVATLPEGHETEPQTSPFAARRNRPEESPSTVQVDINERLASLRPANYNRRPTASDGGDSKQTTDTSAIADQIILGGSNLTKILNITKHDLEQLDQPRVEAPIPRRSTGSNLPETLNKSQSQSSLHPTDFTEQPLCYMQIHHFQKQMLQQLEAMEDHLENLLQGLNR